ncbi:hypothetical protein [Bradyrhizobium sp. BRP56]|uniref:hypothetical protein n=1 Tax=Bradyrhizobium sp. BRP56 TaxID=2793819 RepID=UPI001CD56D77|nr:hypothetical protein [Bradyrhizobium sp. BRP56]MCA1400208.1 hypothetical protein [Bradyrhizobium sp. BRP56]
MRTLITIPMFVHPDGPARSRILVRKYKEECGGDEAIDRANQFVAVRREFIFNEMVIGQFHAAVLVDRHGA